MYSTCTVHVHILYMYCLLRQSIDFYKEMGWVGNSRVHCYNCLLLLLQLHCIGYVSNLIQVLWTTLQEEDVEEPLVLYTHPLDPSNRILHKVMKLLQCMIVRKCVIVICCRCVCVYCIIHVHVQYVHVHVLIPPQIKYNLNKTLFCY